MDNFNLKNYLTNNVLLKEQDDQWDLTGYEYPQEINDMDKEIEELKKQFLELQSRLEAAKRKRNKAKSDFTKTISSLNDDGEFKNLFPGRMGYSKQQQYRFKKVFEKLKSIIQKTGNNWEDLEKILKSNFGGSLKSQHDVNDEGPILYVEGLFAIYTAKNSFVKKHP